MDHTEKSIQQKLHSYYVSNSKYVVPNIYVFDWESDFFVLKENGYCYEFEIKISRSDFKKDAEKIDKHQVLVNGWYTGKKHQNSEKSNRPNKFYYVVPKDLISVDEVPSYAGLIYIISTGFIKAK